MGPKSKFAVLASLAVLLLSAITPVQVAGRDRTGGTLRERLQARREKADDQQSPETQQGRIKGPGDYRYSLMHDGLKREFMVHVPKSYATSKKLALVLALHGGGGGMKYQANDENYGLITASERDGYIVVFPNGYSKNRQGLFATWNAGECCGDARDKNIDDVGFLKAVIEQVQRNASIDRQRIYSIGMSNGGLMSYRLACEIPDIIRGIMPVAGTDNTKVCTPKKAVAVLHVHALNDDHVLYNGGAGKTFRDPSKVNEFTSVPATISKWVALNHANPTAERVLSVPGAHCDLYKAGPGGAPVKLCVTETGMHSWPGGTKSRADEPPSQAIDANKMMWAFFQSL
jgi:polyhydroxybutyrate depolymerase